MSFFGRAANLIKGGIKSIGRPSAEADAKARALEEELARVDAIRERAARRAAEGEARGGAGGAGSGAGRPEPEAPTPSRGPPERDENGEIKRTL